MEHIKLNELHQKEYGVFGVLAHLQYWEPGAHWRTPLGGRINTAMLLPLRCAIRYESPAGKLLGEAAPGSLVLLPQGASYVCRFSPADPLPQLPTLPPQVWSLFLGFTLRDAQGAQFTLESDVRILRPACVAACAAAVVRLHQLSAAGQAIPARCNAEVLRLLTQLSLAQPGGELLSVLLECAQSESVPQIAARCHMSESSFRRAFRTLTGESPAAYLRRMRIDRARQLLESGECSVRAAAFACGYEDEFYFSRVFRRETGMAPREYRCACNARRSRKDEQG